MVSPSEIPGKRVLITGASGFTGRYVIERLQADGYEVVTLGSHAGPSGTASVDLLDRAALQAALEALQPAYVIHLAAISFVAHGDADEIYRVNIVGTRNLLEALAGLPTPPAHVLLASSAGEFNDLAGLRASFKRKPPQLVLRILRGNRRGDLVMR